MSTRLLRAASAAAPAPLTMCRSCLLRSLTAGNQHRRLLHLGTIEKRRLAQVDWAKRAERIRQGLEPNLWDSLKERGYVKDIAGTDKGIAELMRRERIGVYVGIDPTATSLHLGHLLPLMPLFWMYINGYRAVTVVGGATAKVGDPTGRLHARKSLTKAERTMFITKIHVQLKRIWQNVDNLARRHGYTKEWSWNRELVNNSSWHNTAPFYKVVNRLFSGIRLGPMLSRDTVKNRMADGEGMSLGEFVYPMMQAWDWWHMFNSPREVRMQIGGSDQYGNIVAGIDAVKLLRDSEPNEIDRKPPNLENTPVGFTVPLLTDSAGNKYGKSTGSAVWLDPFMTSSFDLYGYFMRRPDADVENLLKLLTFLPLEKIDEIMREHNLDPPKRHAHHILAFEVLALAHNEKEAIATQARHKQFFSKGQTPPASPTSEGELETAPQRGFPLSHESALNFRPDIQLPESLIMGTSIARILYASGLADSATDAHRLVAHRGAYVGGAPGRKPHENVEMSESELTWQPAKNWFPADTKNLLIDGKMLLLRRGKQFVRIVEMISDEEWEASGKSHPGERGKGRLRLLRAQLKAANNGKHINWSPGEMARIGEELLRMEREGDEVLKDADTLTNTPEPPEISFPPQRNRAAKLLDMHGRKRRGQPRIILSSQEKTAAIDAVLNEAREELEERRRIRDQAFKDAEGDPKRRAEILSEARSVLEEKKRARDKALKEEV